MLVKKLTHLIEDAINNKYLTKNFQGIGLKISMTVIGDIMRYFCPDEKVVQRFPKK